MTQKQIARPQAAPPKRYADLFSVFSQETQGTGMGVHDPAKYLETKPVTPQRTGEEE